MTANNRDDNDFTNSQFAHLYNIAIDLETNANIMLRQARRILTPRKRQPVRTLVHNLSTPDKAIKKKAQKNKPVHQPLPDEPKEKKKKKELKLGSCPICFEELGSKPLSATKCGHVFCSDCIKRSIKYFAQCPQCRRKLKGSLAVHPIFLP